MSTIHEPVLLKEVLEYLQPQSGNNFIDGTFGGGGHALAIAEKIKPTGTLIGIEWDKSAVNSGSSSNLIIVNDNYKNIKPIYRRLQSDLKVDGLNGILLDLGWSSDQLEIDGRGFSFKNNDILDLRYDPDSRDLTGRQILQEYGDRRLSQIFKDYGEEPLAMPIAKKIIEARRSGQVIKTTKDLSDLVATVYKKYFKSYSRKNPATRVFQALRIEVNDEFGNIKYALPQALDILSVGGRLAVISFHSGEDRIVKNFFRDESKKDTPKLKLLTKKPIVATEAEIKINPRSRSAKLRVAEKI